MYVKNVINKRIEQENQVGKDIESCNTEIYHDLENKNFDNIVKYIDKHYSYNLKYILLTYSDYLEIHPKKKELLEQITLIINKYTNKEIRETLFGHFKNFDQILDQVKFLKPKEDNEKYNIDALYETLLHISRRKLQEPQNIMTLFAPCSLCWRPALKRHSRVGHFRCPAHFFRKIDGLPARKRAYTRALNITKNMNTWLDRRMLIKKLLEHFPSRDLFGGMILFEWSWWRDDSQTLDKFKDIEYVCRRNPVCHVTVNSISKDIWSSIPEVNNYLITKSINLDDMESIIRTLMSLPNGSQVNEINAYEAIVNRWLNDFRYFLPILADAELWIRAFNEHYGNRILDEQ